MRAAGRLSLVLMVAAVGAWWWFLGPSFMGGRATYVMVSGESMRPTLAPDDLAVVRRQRSYGPGDIVAFRVPKGEPGAGGVVIHRVVGGDGEGGFVLQGDNKRAPDPWRPKRGDVVGKMWFHIPAVGRGASLIRTPLVLAAMAGGLTAAVVMGGARKRRTGRAQTLPKTAPQAGGRPAGAAAGFLVALGTAAWVLAMWHGHDGRKPS